MERSFRDDLVMERSSYFIRFVRKKGQVYLLFSETVLTLLKIYKPVTVSRSDDLVLAGWFQVRGIHYTDFSTWRLI